MRMSENKITYKVLKYYLYSLKLKVIRNDLMHAGECEIDDVFLERAVGKVDQMITDLDTYGLHLPTNIKNIHDRLKSVSLYIMHICFFFNNKTNI